MRKCLGRAAQLEAVRQRFARSEAIKLDQTNIPRTRPDMEPLDLLFLCALALLLPAALVAVAGAALLENRSHAPGLVLVTLGVFLGVSACLAIFVWLQFRLPTNVTGALTP